MIQPELQKFVGLENLLYLYKFRNTGTSDMFKLEIIIPQKYLRLSVQTKSGYISLLASPQKKQGDKFVY